MPYVVACPNCPARLKSQQAVPAGRTITCPQCKSSFTLAEPAKLVSEGSMVLPNGPTKPTDSTRRPDRVADLPDVVDGAGFEFDDNPKPKKARRDDDYDDRPKAKRSRADDDDFEDRPKSKKARRADDDDFEDRPKSKKRRDDDDDFADARPKSKRNRDDDFDDRDRDDDFDDRDEDQPRKKRKKGNNKVLLLALIGGAGAFVLLGVLLLILNLAGVFTLGGGVSSEMLAWAPSDSQVVMFVDHEQVNKFGKDAPFGREADLAKFGLIQNDVSSQLAAGRSNKGGDHDVTVFKLKVSADKQKISEKIGGVESSANGKTYFKGRTHAAYFPSDKLVIITNSDSVMISLLQKDNKVTITEDLKTATGKGKGIVWMAATGTAAEESDFLAMMSNLGNAFGGKGGFGPKVAPPKTKMFTMSMNASGSTMDVSVESTYDSTDAAKRVADGMQKMIDESKLKEKDKDTKVSISQNGSTVSMSASGPLDKDKKKGGGFFPFGL
jgi:hypothetical protein